MSTQEIISRLDANLRGGEFYTLPGETLKERLDPTTGYCLQPRPRKNPWDCESCETCSLVSYGRDCRNNPVATPDN